MSDLRELYEEVIIDHKKNPRNFREMENATTKIDGFNPLCGDKLTLFLKLDGDVITDISFTGAGCAISTASASLMTEALMGKTIAQAETLFENFHILVTDETDFEEKVAEVGKLAVLSGVRQYPSRVKCATLSWHTLNAALHGDSDAVTTE